MLDKADFDTVTRDICVTAPKDLDLQQKKADFHILEA